MKKQVPLTPVLAIALLIITAVAYFTLIGPKRAESAALETEIADLETNLMTATRPKPAAPQVKIDVADLFRLAKAIPDRDDMPGIILEVNSIAASAGVKFVSIQPQPPVESGAYHTIPINLTFEGNYYDLTDFLYRLRNLVTVKDGVLDASGRLYTLDAVDLHEGTDGFPQIQAVLTVSAYAYGQAALPAGTAAAAGTDTTQTTTTGTDTTQTTTTGTDTTQTTTTGTTPTTTTPSGEGDEAAGGTG